MNFTKFLRTPFYSFDKQELEDKYMLKIEFKHSLRKWKICHKAKIEISGWSYEGDLKSWNNNYVLFASNHSELFFKKTVLKKFTKLTGKQLLCRPLCSKLADLQLYHKKDTITDVFLRILRNSSQQLFYKTHVKDYFNLQFLLWSFHVQKILSTKPKKFS